MRRILSRLTPGLLVAALLLVPGGVSAQPRPPAQPIKKAIEVRSGDTDVFRGLLDRAGVKPVSREDVERNRLGSYEDLIVIMLGTHNNRQFGGDPFDFARIAISNGGAALIASDGVLNYWNGNRTAWTDGTRVECDDDPSIHDGKEYCPYVVPITQKESDNAPEADSAAGKLFLGLKRLNHVATNDPSVLRTNGFTGELRFPLARYPKNSTIAGQFQKLNNDALFAIAGDGTDDANRRAYRFLMMADQSVFINQMLLEPGTDNLELTYRVIEYLRGPNKRKRCVFIENGRVMDNFDAIKKALDNQPKRPIPNIPPERIVDFLNGTLDNLQTQNKHNELLLGSPSNPEGQNRRLAAIAIALLILGATWGMWYLMKRGSTARKPNDIPPAPSVAGVPVGPPGVFDRRQKELLRRNNVYEPVRDLVREFFTSIGIVGKQGPKLPKLVISNVVRKPDSLRTAIKDFWRIAFGPPEEITLHRWRDLEPFFERLRLAHADNKWEFVFEEAAV